MSGIQIGEVKHYYDRVRAAVLVLTDQIRIGDAIHILGHSTDFSQSVTSLQIEHRAVDEAGPGQDVALQVEHRVHPGDKVFRIAGETE